MWIYMQMHVLYGVSRYGISFDSRHWLRSQRKRKLTTEEATQDIVEKIRVETLKKSRHPPKRFTHTQTHTFYMCDMCVNGVWGGPLEGRHLGGNLGFLSFVEFGVLSPRIPESLAISQRAFFPPCVAHSSAQFSSLNWQTVMDPLIDSSAMPIRSSSWICLFVLPIYSQLVIASLELAAVFDLFTMRWQRNYYSAKIKSNIGYRPAEKTEVLINWKRMVLCLRNLEKSSGFWSLLLSVYFRLFFFCFHYKWQSIKKLKPLLD